MGLDVQGIYEGEGLCGIKEEGAGGSGDRSSDTCERKGAWAEGVSDFGAVTRKLWPGG